MNWFIRFAALSVVAATFSEFLLMRLQFTLVIILLIAAPVRIVWLALDFGWVASTVGLLACELMFRNQLRYLCAPARGQSPLLPPEMSK